ncbi:MAG: glycosyltransferase family 39 protein [Chloroflexi bacterium]|nr:MAG: glycosyltransferase family 39 protein [Chloroflexota bacterium]
MRTPVTLFAFALVVRAVLVALYPDPAYPDSFYYVDVARALHAGQGFNVDFIWAFVETGGQLPADPHLPIPSNAHWLPLASIIQLPFLAVFGTSPVAGMIPFVIIGATAAPLAWAIARDAGTSSTIAVAAGLMTAVPAASTVFMGQPDNFSLYQPLGAAVLWLGARALKGDRRAFPIAGLLVGVASLARNDGVLLGAALAIAFFWDRWRAWRSGGTRRPVIGWGGAVLCGALFAVVVAPWWIRQLAVFGSISPSSASGRILWIRQITDMNSITVPATFQSFLGQGLGPLIESRVFGFIAAVGNYVIIVLSFVLTPFLFVGAWASRRSVDYRIFFIYSALLFAAAGLVFAIHVPLGMFLHSAVALVPHTYILVLEGVVAAVAWTARRRRSWNEAEATRFFLGATVGVAMLTGALGTWKVQEEWARMRHDRQEVASAMDRLGIGSDERVMSGDTAGFKYFTGRGGVVTVSDPIDVIGHVAQAYDIRWLILERTHIVDTLGPVLKGSVRPSWLGPPAWTLDETPPADADDTYPDIALYPVCVEAGDTRCGSAFTPPGVARVPGPTVSSSISIARP